MDGVRQPLSSHVQQLEQANHLLEAVQARLRMCAGTGALPEGMHLTGRMRAGEERPTKEAKKEPRQSKGLVTEYNKAADGGSKSFGLQWFYLDATTRNV